MEVFRLPVAIRESFTQNENRIREKYLQTVCDLELNDLKNFNKHEYKEIMFKEMRKAIDPSVSDDIIKIHCHYVFNALNNECLRELGLRSKNHQHYRFGK